MNSFIRNLARKMDIPKDVVSFVIDQKTEHPKYSYERIKNSVRHQLQHELEIDDIKKIWEEAKNQQTGDVSQLQSEVQKLNAEIEETRNYDVDNDNYIFFVTKPARTSWEKLQERYTLPIEYVDRIFEHYSTYGKNYSKQQILDEFGLKSEVFNLLKSRLNLNKFSHILSPISMENSEKSWNLEAKIVDATYSNMQDKYKNKYKDASNTLMEKEFKKLSKTLWQVEGFLEHLQPWINKREPISIGHIKEAKNKGNIPNFLFADTHFGKIETELVKKRLELFTQDVINHPANEVYVTFAWDIFETLVQGGMHNWQVESMDNVYWYDLFMYGVAQLEKMLVDIHKTGKKVTFVGIGGNHDRASMQNEHDRQRVYALLAFSFIKRGLEKTKIIVKIIREKTEAFKVGNINYIVNHGEETRGKKPQEIAWNYWDNKSENVIVTAHLHNVEVKEAKNVTHLRVPALAGQNQYDKDLWLFSHPWYAIVEENAWKKADIIIKRLP